MSNPLVANLNNLAITITQIFGVTFISFGVIIDLFAIYTFSRLQNSKKSKMSLLYKVLGIYDILALLTYTVIYTLSAYGFKLANTSDPMCKIVLVLRRTLVVCPSWTETLITFDRFRNVICPQKYKFMTKIRTLKIILGKRIPLFFKGPLGIYLKTS